MGNEELQSKVIDFLRFPLIIGIVFIHNDALTELMQSKGVVIDADILIYPIISKLFSKVLGCISVPFFFFISGFLFFFHTDFNKDGYSKKLKNRIKTLLIPYLFWNSMTLLLFYIISRIAVLLTWVQVKEFNLEYIVSSLWGIKNRNSDMTYPINTPFWFIRDLIVVVLLTPVLYSYIKRFKIYGVLLLGILWYTGCWFSFIGTHGLSIVALFFFTVGAWFSINKKNLVEEFDKIKHISFCFFPLIVVINLLIKENNNNYLIYQLGILLGIAFFFNLVGCLLNNEKIKVNAFLSASSFFIFAIHGWLLRPIKRIFFNLFTPESDLSLTSFYFMAPLLAVCISLILYYLLKRFCPTFTKIITGGR